MTFVCLCVCVLYPQKDADIHTPLSRTYRHTTMMILKKKRLVCAPSCRLNIDIKNTPSYTNTHTHTVFTAYSPQWRAWCRHLIMKGTHKKPPNIRKKFKLCVGVYVGVCVEEKEEMEVTRLCSCDFEGHIHTQKCTCRLKIAQDRSE